MGIKALIQAVEASHDTVFSMLDRLSEENLTRPEVRSAVLQLFLVDFEVLRNLFELYTGESPDPEMLDREDHASWYQQSHRRMGHWSLAEVAERARQVRTDLLDQLSLPIPQGLTETDLRIRALTRFSTDAAEEVASCLAPLVSRT